MLEKKTIRIWFIIVLNQTTINETFGNWGSDFLLTNFSELIIVDLRSLGSCKAPFLPFISACIHWHLLSSWDISLIKRFQYHHFYTLNLICVKLKEKKGKKNKSENVGGNLQIVFSKESKKLLNHWKNGWSNSPAFPHKLVLWRFSLFSF